MNHAGLSLISVVVSAGGWSTSIEIGVIPTALVLGTAHRIQIYKGITPRPPAPYVSDPYRCTSRASYDLTVYY